MGLPLPGYKCKQVLADAQLRAAIVAIAECLPDSEEVQDIANELMVCSPLYVVEDIYIRLLSAALCSLETGLGDTCDRPYACGVLQINTNATVNSETMPIWDQWTTGFNFPYLVTMFGAMYFSLNGSTPQPTMFFLRTVTLPVLQQAYGIYCGGQEVLESFSAPALRLITGLDLNVSGNGGLTSYDFTALEDVEGSLILDGQLNTTALFPVLTRVGGASIALGGNLVELVDISALTTFDGNFSCSQARLDEAQVNAILIKMDDLVLTNRDVLLNGTDMAPPTGAGITAKNNLIGRGCNVVTS